MNDSLISVIIPTFNRSYSIIRALESVFNQTYKNVEVIIIDDNSTDDTVEVLSDYIESKQITYQKNEENFGATLSRNIGASLSKGKYLAFLDSDDEWHEYKLTDQIEAFMTHSNVGMVFSGRKEINENSEQSVNYLPESRIYTESEILEGDPIGSNSGPLIKREVFDKVKGYDFSLKARQDWDLWIRISQISLVLGINKVSYNYYYGRKDQISNGIDRKYIATIQLFKKHNDKFSKNEAAKFNILKTIALMSVRLNKKEEALNMIPKKGNIKLKLIRMILITFSSHNIVRIHQIYCYRIKKTTSYLDW